MLEDCGFGNVKWALELVRSTKGNLIGYYESQDKNGKYIYKRIVDDLLDDWVGTMEQKVFNYELELK